MAQARSLGFPRPASSDDIHRVYAVTSESSTERGRCTLDDGSAVVYAFESMATAIEAVTDDPSLRLVRHRALSTEEQARVESALLT